MFFAAATSVIWGLNEFWWMRTVHCLLFGLVCNWCMYGHWKNVPTCIATHSGLLVDCEVINWELCWWNIWSIGDESTLGVLKTSGPVLVASSCIMSKVLVCSISCNMLLVYTLEWPLSTEQCRMVVQTTAVYTMPSLIALSTDESGNLCFWMPVIQRKLCRYRIFPGQVTIFGGGDGILLKEL